MGYPKFGKPLMLDVNIYFSMDKWWISVGGLRNMMLINFLSKMLFIFLRMSLFI